MTAMLRPLYTTSCWRRGFVAPLTRFRPALPLVQKWTFARFESLEAGEDKSGHIKEAADKAIFYFDTVYPLHLSWLVSYPLQTDSNLNLSQDKANWPQQSLSPLDILNAAVAGAGAAEVIPRPREGGAFVKLTLPAGETAASSEAALRAHLKTARPRPWWSPLHSARARLVRGKPWVEDLHRLPSARLRVEFLGSAPGEPAAELSQELLYQFFRPYGKLADILPQPFDSKVVPRYAYLDFLSVRRAVMAKNCLHGFVVCEADGGGKMGTVLRISYERKAKTNWIKDWIFNHPRMMIPILAALVAAISVAVFDPIRTFFIKIHITHFYHLGDSRIFRWFKSQATDLFRLRKRGEDLGLNVIWDDRRSNINQIQSWLMESSDTFIIVQGPRGSGKKELVTGEALKGRTKLIIDCKPIQEAKGESKTIGAAAAQVGYRPVFSFMNTVSGWIDLAAQGATGVKTGFSETLDTQLVNIFNSTGTALRQIALQGRKKSDKDANLTDDEYLEAHPEKRPVVVVDNFLHKSQDRTIIYDKIAEWAAGLTTSNIAHIIFLTHDISFSKSLSKALPDRVFRLMPLRDSSPEAAKQFVISRLDADSVAEADPNNPEKKLTPSQRRNDLTELDQSIATVGGRLSDLEFLARRIKMGETPLKAAREIVGQSASEILKMYLLNADESSTGQRKWTAVQAWTLIKQLAKSENATLRYNEVVLDDAFKTGGGGSPDAVLQALEQAELISIVVSPHGRPHSIRPGKPVYQAAFVRLTEDRVLQSRLDLAVCAELVKAESATIDRAEEELKLLVGLPRQPRELAGRERWLLGKIAGSQAKVERLEAQSAALKAVLLTEF